MLDNHIGLYNQWHSHLFELAWIPNFNTSFFFLKLTHMHPHMLMEQMGAIAAEFTLVAREQRHITQTKWVDIPSITIGKFHRIGRWTRLLMVIHSQPGIIHFSSRGVRFWWGMIFYIICCPVLNGQVHSSIAIGIADVIHGMRVRRCKRTTRGR